MLYVQAVLKTLKQADITYEISTGMEWDGVFACVWRMAEWACDLCLLMLLIGFVY